jgi:hypothetical protein
MSLATPITILYIGLNGIRAVVREESPTLGVKGEET